MRVSVVITTLNRAGTLRQVLQALRYQTYGLFEVIVVNGPSTDGTAKLLDEFSGDIRVANCPTANASKGRNIGTALAAGEIVAFIDDDAIPDPRWIEGLVGGYDSPAVSGVGGLIYDATGVRIQWGQVTFNRRGDNLVIKPLPEWQHVPAGSDMFTGLVTANASYRRDVLVDVGGFDERLEFFCEDIDVTMRVIDRGGQVRISEHAVVYHQIAQSRTRHPLRIVRDPFFIAKNKMLYALQATEPGDDPHQVVRECLPFLQWLTARARQDNIAGRLTERELALFEKNMERGKRLGIKKGLTSRHRLNNLPSAEPPPFKPFPRLRPTTERMTVCFVSQFVPPERNGGVGRFMLDLAEGFAALGHEAHLITSSSDQNSLEFHRGLWIHRVVHEPVQLERPLMVLPAVRQMLNRATAVHREVLRIAASRPVDVVSLPLWNCEGLLCLLDDNLTCVQTLQTGIGLLSSIDPMWKGKPEVPQMISLERYTVRAARHVHAISHDVLRQMRRDYGAPSKPAEAFVIPLGVVDRALEYHPRSPDGSIRILFVGRFERRKGIHLLLEAAAILVRENPQVEFHLVGENTHPTDSGVTFREAFEALHAHEPESRRIHFPGEVTEEQLYQQYAECDIYCQPSLYESFGLTFVEAMMFGKPVVGCRAGGMEEVIEHDSCGLLCEPLNLCSLLRALRRLIENESLRKEFGARARRLYEARFTARTMVQNTARAYARIAGRESYQHERSLR